MTGTDTGSVVAVISAGWGIGTAFGHPGVGVALPAALIVVLEHAAYLEEREAGNDS